MLTMHRLRPHKLILVSHRPVFKKQCGSPGKGGTAPGAEMMKILGTGSE